MWQVCVSLAPAAFIPPPAGRLVSITHLTLLMCTSHIWAGIAHICLIFAPNLKFHWAASTSRLYFELWTSVNWSWLWHQLTCLIFDAWRRILHHFDACDPSPMHFTCTCCLLGPMRSTQVLYNLLKIFKVHRRQASLYHPMLEWRFFTCGCQTKHVLQDSRLLDPSCERT